MLTLNSELVDKDGVCLTEHTFESDSHRHVLAAALAWGTLRLAEYASNPDVKAVHTIVQEQPRDWYHRLTVLFPTLVGEPLYADRDWVESYYDGALGAVSNNTDLEGQAAVEEALKRTALAIALITHGSECPSLNCPRRA